MGYVRPRLRSTFTAAVVATALGMWVLAMGEQYGLRPDSRGAERAHSFVAHPGSEFTIDIGSPPLGDDPSDAHHEALAAAVLPNLLGTVLARAGAMRVVFAVTVRPARRVVPTLVL